MKLNMILNKLSSILYQYQIDEGNCIKQVNSNYKADKFSLTISEADGDELFTIPSYFIRTFAYELIHVYQSYSDGDEFKIPWNNKLELMYACAESTGGEHRNFVLIKRDYRKNFKSHKHEHRIVMDYNEFGKFIRDMERYHRYVEDEMEDSMP